MDGDEGARRWVFGLCADWCGTCREWRAVFDAAAARHPRDRFVWIDIEDDDELVGDIDIDTFPTLLVGTDDSVLFFGAILPSPELFARLLASLDAAQAAATAPQSHALLQRLVAAQL